MNLRLPCHGAHVVRCALSTSFAGSLFFVSARADADYPIASHRFLADPASLVHEGRLYLYGSNDDDNVTDDGYRMASIICVSSSDLKNWTDHGEVLRVPRDASWASYSWAPAMIQRNGRIYMYFGNNANGIGVASSTTPTGRFTDAKGSALVTSSTPGASGTNSWLFDPGVFIDDDQQAYLYFGGNGEGNARVIRLNADMVSVSGSAMPLTVPYFFEAAWMHERSGTYYFSYSTNPENGLRIDYLTSTSPTGGFTHRGTVGPQPPSNENNNHAAIFEFGGAWYHAYHNRYVANQTGVPPGYKRNLALERLEYEADGTIRPVVYTTDGLVQLANLNPYSRVEAETFNAQSGVETEPCNEGGMNLSEIESGDWVRLRGVDFGAGARSFSARVASASGGGNIEVRLASETGILAGTCPVAVTGGAQTWTTATCDVSGATGVNDVVLRFTGGSGSRLFNVNHWQFTPHDGGMGGAGGGGGGAGVPPGGMAGTDRGGSGGSNGGGAGGSATTAGAGGDITGGASGGPASGAGGTSSAGMPGSGGVGASGGAPAGGAPGGSGGGAAGPGGYAAPAAGDESGGCGCRTSRGSSPWAVFASIAFVALGFAALRRQRSSLTRSRGGGGVASAETTSPRRRGSAREPDRVSRDARSGSELSKFDA